MLLAFLYELSNGDSGLPLPMGGQTPLSIGLPPLEFNSPMQIVEHLSDDEEETEEDSELLDEEELEGTSDNDFEDQS